MNDTAKVRLDLTPDDREMVRKHEQEQARQHADQIGNPAGLAGLFPTNRVRFGMRTGKTALPRPNQ